MADLFINFIRRLSIAFGVFSAALLIVAVLVVCHLVFVRYALGESAIWQHEFVTFSLIASTFVGSPYVLLTRGHVNVDLLPHYVGSRTRFWLAVAGATISMAFCVLIAVLGYAWWREALDGGWRGETVWAPPLWIPYLSMPLGFGLLSLQYIADIVALISGRRLPFDMPADEGRQ